MSDPEEGVDIYREFDISEIIWRRTEIIRNEEKIMGIEDFNQTSYMETDLTYVVTEHRCILLGNL